MPEPLADHDIPTAMDNLIVAGVRAAVIAQDRELRRWWSWTWHFDPGLIERLVEDGRLSRPAPGWVALGASATPAFTRRG